MKNKFCFLLFNFGLIVLFTIFGILLIIDPEKFESFSIAHTTNDFCQNKDNITTYIDSLVCVNPYKKKKFLWLFLDGLAYDQLELLTDRKVHKIPNLFKTSSKMYRQSGSLHEIILTGKFSRNYPARQIRSDYLFTQASQANFELYFRGTNFPLYFLFGGENSVTVKHSALLYPDWYALLNFCGDLVFYNVSSETFQKAMSKYFTEDGELIISRSDFYKKMREYYEYGINLDAITNCLVRSLNIDPMISNQKSLIFYMSKIDNMNHSFYKHSAYVIMQVFNTEIGLISLMKWVDQNPDYALIVSSDHGGQAYTGEDNLCNHGCMTEGNESIFFIYTHDLGENFDKEYLETANAEMEEIAPTVAQILENVNIPIEARGFPKFLSNDPLVKLVALKSKEIQIKKYIEASQGSVQLQNLYKSLITNKYSAKLAEFTSMEEFSIKSLNSSFMLDMSIELFINQYQEFLRKVQDEVVIDIRNSNKSIIVSMFIFFVIFILIGKSSISIKCMIQYLGSGKQSLIFFPLLLSLLMEVIFCFLFKNQIPDIISISRFLVYPVLVLVGAWFYFMLEDAKQKVFQYKMRNMILIFLCISIAFPAIDATKIFLGLKYLVISYQFARRLDYFNYLLIITYSIIFTTQFRNVYVTSRLTFKVSSVLCLFILILFPCMFLFDFFYPKHFVRQEYHMKILIRFTYMIMFSLLVFSFKQFYAKKSDPQEKQSIVSKPILSMKLAKLPFVLYLFYISDEGERLFLLTCILPLFHLFSEIYTTTQNDQPILKAYIAVGMIWLPDVLFIIMKGTFTLDVSLKVCTKSIGDYPDQTPIATGILMGTHKAALYLLSGAFALGMIKINKNCINDHSFIFRQALELQISFLLMLYFTILLREQEEDYLTLFMWAISKCVFAYIFDIFTFVCYLKHYMTSKPNIVADSNNSEESITIINNEV